MNTINGQISINGFEKGKTPAPKKSRPASEQFSAYRQVHVLCPFYCGDNNRNAIRCEGIIGDSGTHYFRSAEALTDHMENFCCDDFTCCTIYRVLISMYDEKGDKG